MRKLVSGLIVVIIGFGLVACGDDDDDSGTVASSDSGETHENTVTVKASGTAFDPTTAEATAGEVYFEVTNEDNTKHTFTIDDADVDIALDPKGSGEAEADLEAGEYEWHCTIHSSMTGTLTVT
jgi:plastocyanin